MKVLIDTVEAVPELHDALARCATLLTDELRKLDRGPRRWASASDPELRRQLESIRDACAEVARLEEVRPIGAPLRRRIADVLTVLRERLPDLDAEEAWGLRHELQLLLLEVADVDLVSGIVEGELLWRKGDIGWLTWRELFGDETPEGITAYRAGREPSEDQLAAERHDLLSLFRARHADEVMHRSRVEERARNLFRLSAILLVLLPLAILTYDYASKDDTPGAWRLVMVALAGALGAALSGTLKARDTLTRETDIRRFRDALLAQLLVGATLAFFVYVILRSGVVSIDTLRVNAAGGALVTGFLAGFAEPFSLGIVGRAVKLGSQGDAKEKEAAKA